MNCPIMFGKWPMCGFSPGNSHYHPNGASLTNSPEKLKSVQFAQVAPADVGRITIPPSQPVIEDDILYFIILSQESSTIL